MAAASFVLISVYAGKSVPEWWIRAGITSEGENEFSEQKIEENLSAANVGQLMNVAVKAAEEIKEEIPLMGAEGEAITALVGSFGQYKYDAARPEESDGNFNVLNIGQLKHVAKTFYDGLYKLSPEKVTWPWDVYGGQDSLHGKYPWPPMPANPAEEDYAPNFEAANIGQIKYLFAWSVNHWLPSEGDSDGDGIPDDIEYGWSKWSPEAEAARMFKIEPVGESMFLGADGVKLPSPIRFRVTDEKGKPVVGAPLLIEKDFGANTSPELEDGGVYAFSFTPEFPQTGEEKVDANEISVKIDSERAFGNAKFTVLKEKAYTQITPHSMFRLSWAPDKYSKSGKGDGHPKALPPIYSTDCSYYISTDWPMPNVSKKCTSTIWWVSELLPNFPSDGKSGTQYRKVSLAGRPMPGAKPQLEDESDNIPPETYIDPLTMQVCHNTSDIEISIPMSEMKLSLRRNHQSALWNFQSGLRPHENPANVFGATWTTNATPHIMMKRQRASDAHRSYPDTATVSDENGESFSYSIADAGFTGRGGAVVMFFPSPTGRSGQTAYLNQLYYESETQDLVLEKRFGTKLRFERTPSIVIGAIPDDRINRLNYGNNAKWQYEYYRIKSAEDRFGNKIVYEYPADAQTIIPQKIYVEGRPELCITLEENNGKITKAWDPEGNCISYSYETLEITGKTPRITDISSIYFARLNVAVKHYITWLVPNDPTTGPEATHRNMIDDLVVPTKTADVMTAVARNGIKTSGYEYSLQAQTNMKTYMLNYAGGYYQREYESYLLEGNIGSQYNKYMQYAYIYDFHINLTSITDGSSHNGQERKIGFEYKTWEGQVEIDYETERFWENNFRQMAISKVTLPNGSSATFTPESRTLFLPVRDIGGDGSISIGIPIGMFEKFGNMLYRKTRIIDADGKEVLYTWFNRNGVAVYPLPHDIKCIDEDPFGSVKAYVPDFRLPSYYGVTDYSQAFRMTGDVYYPDMKITYYDDGEITAKEEYKFKYEAGLALEHFTDCAENYHNYRYGEGIPSSDIASTYKIVMPDPICEEFIDFSGVEKIRKYYAYTEPKKSGKSGFDFRIMTSATDELGRETVTDVDGQGRRIACRVYADTSRSELLSETLFEYTGNNFLSKTTVKNAFGPGRDMVTANTPDSCGRIAQSVVDPGGLNLVTKYAYNRNGRKTLVTDPNGNTTRFEYDGFNRLVKVLNPDGSSKTIAYDTAGRKTKEVNENGVTMLYSYDANGLNSETRLVMGGSSSGDIVTLSSYTNTGKIRRKTDPNGNVTEFSYDSLGRKTEMTQFEGGKSYTTKYGFHRSGGSYVFSGEEFKPTEVIDPSGNMTIYQYDPWRRLTETYDLEFEYERDNYYIYKHDLDAEQGTEQYNKRAIAKCDYDYAGNKIREYDALGNMTAHEYDGLNHLVKSTFADGTQKTFTYGSNIKGALLSETNELGHTTTYEYDGAGRNVRTMFPPAENGLTGEFEIPEENLFYDANGNLIGRRDATNRLFNFTFDSRNRQTSEISPAVKVMDGAKERYLRPTSVKKYDNMGNVVKATDPNGNATLYEFDNANRNTKIIFPAVHNGEGPMENPVELLGYDGNGNITSRIDPNGIKTATTYNRLNKPLSIARNAGTQDAITESYAYDAVGNITKIIDGRGSVTTYEYENNPRYRRLKTNYGAGSSTTRSDEFEYDLQNMTKRKGVSLTYDARNRIVGEGDRIYAYDAAGRLTSATAEDARQNVSYEYDALGRQISENNNGKTNRYYFDLAGRQTKAVFGISGDSPPTHTQETTYDSIGRISSITDQLGRATTYEYDMMENVVRKTNPTGHVTLNTFDALNRLAARSGEHMDMRYYFDLGGNVTSFTETYGGLKTWKMSASYDAFDRLKSDSLAEYPAGDVHGREFTYDNAGNRTSEVYTHTEASGAETVKQTFYAINALNQIEDISGTMSRTSGGSVEHLPFTAPKVYYNDRGNVSKIVEGVKTVELAYDQFDMLEGTTVKQNGTAVNTTANVYDHRGRRLSHTSGDTTTAYFYAGGTSASETKADESGAKTTLFYRGSDMGGGVGGINYAEFADGTDLNYKFYNLRGDVVMTLGSDGAVKSASYYHAFGKHDDRLGGIETDKHRANTKVEDDDGLLNEGKRFRSLEYAIFLTPDPLEYQDGLNFYLYCGQNPWGRFDPIGLKPPKYGPSMGRTIRFSNSTGSVSVTSGSGGAYANAYVSLNSSLYTGRKETFSSYVEYEMKLFNKNKGSWDTPDKANGVVARNVHSDGQMINMKIPLFLNEGQNSDYFGSAESSALIIQGKQIIREGAVDESKVEKKPSIGVADYNPDSQSYDGTASNQDNIDYYARHNMRGSPALSYASDDFKDNDGGIVAERSFSYSIFIDHDNMEYESRSGENLKNKESTDNRSHTNYTEKEKKQPSRPRK